MGTGNMQLPPLQPQVAWAIELDESHYSDEEFEDYTEEAAASGNVQEAMINSTGAPSPLLEIPVPIMLHIMGYLDLEDLKIFFLSLRYITCYEPDLKIEKYG